VTLNAAAAAAAIVWLNTEEEGRKDIARALKLRRMRPIYLFNSNPWMDSPPFFCGGHHIIIKKNTALVF